MAPISPARDLVIGITPGHEPCADLVVAIERAGYLGVLDLGPDVAAGRAALERVRERLGRPFGVRISGPAGELPADVDTVLVDAPLLADALLVGSGFPPGPGGACSPR